MDVANLDDTVLAKQYETEPELSNYKSFVEELRRQKPHNLSKDVERALTVRSPYVGTRPLVSFFDKELSLMRFKIDDGEEVNMEVLLSRMQSSSDAEFRAKCLKVLNDGLAGSVSRTAALSLSAVSGGWLIENKERKYTTLRSRRNLDNNCPDAVVDSLLDGVREAGVPLCKRFYTLKKGILQKTQGLEKLKWSDRNAPIDIGGVSKDKISWESAVAMVAIPVVKTLLHDPTVVAVLALAQGILRILRVPCPLAEFKALAIRSLADRGVVFADVAGVVASFFE